MQNVIEEKMDQILINPSLQSCEHPRRLFKEVLTAVALISSWIIIGYYPLLLREMNSSVGADQRHVIFNRVVDG